jgi:hypothetical protein
MTGFEPATSGATVRRSTAELHPPYKRSRAGSKEPALHVRRCMCRARSYRPRLTSIPKQISVAPALTRSQSGAPLERGRAGFDEVVVNLDERAIPHIHRGLVDVIGLAALRVVHQLIRAMDQFRRQLPRDAASLGDRAEMKTDDADIDADRSYREPPIVAAPVVRFDGVLEPIGDLDRLGATRKIRDQKAELVAAESSMQIARISASAFQREKVL